MLITPIGWRHQILFLHTCSNLLARLLLTNQTYMKELKSKMGGRNLMSVMSNQLFLFEQNIKTIDIRSLHKPKELWQIIDRTLNTLTHGLHFSASKSRDVSWESWGGREGERVESLPLQCSFSCRSSRSVNVRHHHKLQSAAASRSSQWPLARSRSQEYYHPPGSGRELCQILEKCGYSVMKWTRHWLRGKKGLTNHLHTVRSCCLQADYIWDKFMQWIQL